MGQILWGLIFLIGLGIFVGTGKLYEYFFGSKHKAELYRMGFEDGYYGKSPCLGQQEYTEAYQIGLTAARQGDPFDAEEYVNPYVKRNFQKR